MADMGNEGRSDKIVKDYYFKGEMNQLFLGFIGKLFIKS